MRGFRVLGIEGFGLSMLKRYHRNQLLILLNTFFIILPITTDEHLVVQKEL